MSVKAGVSPEWATWAGGRTSTAYTLGIEEEAMLLDPRDWSLAHEIDSVLPALPPALVPHVTAETHGSALELATGVHGTVTEATSQLYGLRLGLERVLVGMGLHAASAGTHPFAVWHETKVSSGERYQLVYGSMRELARREPTFALHVHIGMPGPEEAVRAANRLRGHLPILLALSVNSPFWQGRDTGLSSARTPLFQAFPRVGIPRMFDSYAEFTEAVDILIRCEAIREPTFLWWDVRVQPRFGTVEVRIMDAQATVDETAALAALVQSVARLEVEEGYLSPSLLAMPEVLEENRFIAARDGMDGRLIDPDRELRVPVRELVEALVEAAMPHAQELGCDRELATVAELARRTGAGRQLSVAREGDRLPGLVAALADVYGRPPGQGRMARLEVGGRY